MDSTDLLARENEFKKLNKQLEKKTESLIKQIENAMQKQDIFSEFSKSLTQDLYEENTIKKHCCTSTNNTPLSSNRSTNKEKNTQTPIRAQNLGSDIHKPADCANLNIVCADTHNFKSNCVCYHEPRIIDNNYEFLQAFVSVNVQENVLPKSFIKDGVTVESVCKFLSSKIKLMEEQKNKLQSTINKKAEQCEKHLKSQAELEGERLALLNKANNMAAASADMKAKYLAANNRYNEKDKLYKEQRAECDKISSELKRLRSKNATLEARCAHQEHCIETLSQQLQTAGRTEKEFREASRSLAKEHQSAISVLEQRTKNLTSKIDKQNALIENLRKQNALLLTDGALKALEGKYCTLLKDFN